MPLSQSQVTEVEEMVGVDCSQTYNKRNHVGAQKVIANNKNMANPLKQWLITWVMGVLDWRVVSEQEVVCELLVFLDTDRSTACFQKRRICPEEVIDRL